MSRKPRPPFLHRNVTVPRYVMEPQPAPFKVANKPPVTGGRWAVRRYAYPDKNGLLWYAYSRGIASAFTTAFKTHAEALNHAQQIAGYFQQAGVLRPILIAASKRVRIVERNETYTRLAGASFDDFLDAIARHAHLHEIIHRDELDPDELKELVKHLTQRRSRYLLPVDHGRRTP